MVVITLIELPLTTGYLVLLHSLVKTIPNDMLVGMASKISQKYTYKCMGWPRHNGIKGAKSLAIPTNISFGIVLNISCS